MLFKLNNLLHLQYDGMLVKIFGDFVNKEVYELSGNCLTVLGRPFSVSISLLDGEAEKTDAFETRTDIDPDMLPEVKEGTLVAEVLKYILMQIRLYRDIKPVADEYMRSVLTGKLNDVLKFYDLATSDEGCAVFTLEGKPVDAETVLRMAGDVSYINEILGDVDIDYAKRLMGLLRYKEALEIFLPLLERTREGSMFNTEINFYVGEIYFHMDELDKALEYYRACNPMYIKDMKDYCIRMGHCINDDKAGLRASLIKMYHRCCLNPTYKKSIIDKYDRLKEQVEPIIEEYEVKCEEAGRALLEE